MPIIDNIRNAATNWQSRQVARAMPTPHTGAQRQLPPQNRSNGRGTANLNGGGVVNYGTGLGTNLDHSQGSFFTPTRLYWRTPLETLAVESWVARNAIDIPTDDMFVRWRQFTSDDEGIVKAMEEGQKALKMETALAEAMKAADQYGTGIVVMVTGEDTLDTPLDVRRIREGDLKALHYFDRYDCSVTNRIYDFQSPFYGEPEWYRVHPNHGGGSQTVHHTRILRFDGIRPPTKSGFTAYDQDFGVSVLVPIIVSIMEDSTLAQAVAHLSQEASTPVVHIAGLREALAGGGDPDEASPEEIGQQINRMKSVFRLLMLDEPGREEFIRVAVSFGGLPDLMDKYQGRVAAARKIPLTRFTGSPPIGMNSTGEHDMDNYILMMESNRAKKLRDPLERLDIVLARHVGIKVDPPEYEWQSLLELSDKDLADAFKVKADGWKILVDMYAADEDEMREAFNGDPAVGELSGPAPEAPDPIAMIEAETNAKMGANGNGGPPANGNGNGNGDARHLIRKW